MTMGWPVCWCVRLLGAAPAPGFLLGCSTKPRNTYSKSASLMPKLFIAPHYFTLYFDNYNEYSYLIWQVSKYNEMSLENGDNKYRVRNMGLLLFSFWIVRNIVLVFLHRHQELKTYSFFYFKKKLWSSCNHLSPGRPFKKNKIPRDEGQFKRVRSNAFVLEILIWFFGDLIFCSELQRP